LFYFVRQKKKKIAGDGSFMVVMGDGVNKYGS
jgi:hypothetical protein